MGRWQPGARGRLADAAMELYLERGYDATTVADIADRAGLTERTFFRHYADKREVLFGSTVFRDLVVDALLRQPLEMAPLPAVAAALGSLDDFFSDRGHSTQRQRVIDANSVLQERELIKLASLSADLAHALRERGADDSTAGLTAETGMAVFKVAFARWVAGSDERPFSVLVDEAFTALRNAAAAT